MDNEDIERLMKLMIPESDPAFDKAIHDALMFGFGNGAARRYSDLVAVRNEINWYGMTAVGQMTGYSIQADNSPNDFMIENMVVKTTETVFGVQIPAMSPIVQPDFWITDWAAFTDPNRVPRDTRFDAGGRDVSHLMHMMHDGKVSTADMRMLREAVDIHLVKLDVASLPAHGVGDTPPPPSTDVDRVIDQLDRRIVGDRDRGRLRDAVDRADAPLTGRRGADEGIGRAITKVHHHDPLVGSRK